MKVLVTVASRHGSTAEMGEVIASTLSRAGIETVVLSPDAVESLAEYDGVVLGSAVYLGRWLEDARSFADRFGSAFERIPVWAFSSGPLGEPPKPSETPADVVALLERLAVREHRVFPGEIDRSELGIAEKLITRAVGAPEGDFRPWSEVQAWAEGIATALQEEHARLATTLRGA